MDKVTETIKNKVDIVQLIERSGVSLVRRGRYWKGLCPFHPDKDSPSLTVYPNTNSFYCFGCQESGDVITWVMLQNGWDFILAVDWLCDNKLELAQKEVLPFSPKPKKQKVLPHQLIVYWHKLLNEKEKQEWFINRGFTELTISSEMFGWDGSSYVIPVWEGKPGDSDCWGVRLRQAVKNSNFPKYRGLREYNQATVYGKYFCQNADVALCFAGELDARRAVQDGFPSFSLVNGVSAWKRFSPDWPIVWFPSVERLVVVFDRKEEVFAGQLAVSWNKIKGFNSALVFHWPEVEGKDYCEFRDSGGTFHSFRQMIQEQSKITI